MAKGDSQDAHGRRGAGGLIFGSLATSAGETDAGAGTGVDECMALAQKGLHRSPGARVSDEQPGFANVSRVPIWEQACAYSRSRSG